MHVIENRSGRLLRCLLDDSFAFGIDLCRIVVSRHGMGIHRTILSPHTAGFFHQPNEMAIQQHYHHIIDIPASSRSLVRDCIVTGAYFPVLHPAFSHREVGR